MILIKNSHIRLYGYIILILNIVVFFLTWVRLYISIPATILLIIGLYKLKENITSDKSQISILKKDLIITCVIMIAWIIFSGLGGAFPQKNDLNIRNAILHDLINYSWPVRYADISDSSLTYYIAFWIIPAFIGKITTLFLGIKAGWLAANIAYATYCAVILCLVILLLISFLKATTFKRILLIAVLLIFFSGMDIVPIILTQIGNKTISIVTNLEWWNYYLQYSSNTTQLCWVYNQAIPAWLVTALLLHEDGITHYAFLGLLLLPYGPLPFIGIFVLMVFQGTIVIISSLRKKNKVSIYFKQVFSTPNISAIISILPIYYFYYSTNAATSSKGYNLNSIPFIYYFMFILVEFLIYAILIFRFSYKKRFFYIAIIGLIFVPFFTLGGAQDFCMRASIPFLFILMVYIMDYLLSNISIVEKGLFKINAGAIILIILLTIGSATPLAEFRQSYTQIVLHKSFIADKYGTLNIPGLGRGNFITENASGTVFYKYIAKIPSGK